uniref:Protein pitchfork n=1 Tax=Apteryx owenii TaxID=8824 RepID=A0A8B9QWD4_APTOW
AWVTEGDTLAQYRISFGSCQERKLFPLHHAPDRLGIQLIPIRGDPWLGPGCYQNHKVSFFGFHAQSFSFTADIQYRSSKTMTVTPGPGMYQSWWKKERKCQPAYAPFSIKSPRFPDKPLDREFFPGPGTYEADKLLHKKVTWPMKFGSPDWSLVPMPVKTTLGAELIADREFRKHRNRMAYLSLYYG